MKRVTLIGVLCSLIAAAFAIDTENAFDDPVMNARYQSLIHEIRCMKCQNQSIADSPIDVAADLRRQVRDMLAAGQTDAAVKDYLASRYGDFILYRPPLKPTTWVLWAGPAILLLIGGFVFARIIRERTTQLVDEEAGS